MPEPSCPFPMQTLEVGKAGDLNPISKSLNIQYFILKITSCHRISWHGLVKRILYIFPSWSNPTSLCLGERYNIFLLLFSLCNQQQKWKKFDPLSVSFVCFLNIRRIIKYYIMYKIHGGYKITLKDGV